MPPPDDFIKAFMDLLCQLYQWLGGDCADLSEDPSKAIDEVDAAYASSGPPTFSSPQEEQEFLTLLDNVDEMLAAPENPLSSADTQQMIELIEKIRNDLA